ncbi:MAG: hypothetical protein WBE86_05120 [Candidatus Acidiferrales bacterium]
MNAEMRKHALRRYLVFRVKLIEFLDMAGLWELLRQNQLQPQNSVGRQPKDFTDSLQTVLLSWFALFVDKNGMNVIELWKELFPNRNEEIEQSWQRMAPTWKVIRQFRDKAGFHADKPRAFFNARSKKSRNWQMISDALAEFQKLQGAILKAESTELADFPAAVDAFLDELETAGHKYDRAGFKRYLMIPDSKPPV